MNLVYRVARDIERTYKLRRHSVEADFFLLSYPKSGRTWLRFLLSHYINALKNTDDAIDLQNMFCVLPNFDLDPVRGIPAYRYAQDVYVPNVWVSHLPYNRLLFLNRPVIFIIRDPRDVVVSAFFHATRHKRRFEGDIVSFLRDPEQGVPALCRYLNGWAKGLAERRAHVVTYEALSADPVAELTKVVTFVGLPVLPALIMSAIVAGKFDSMQALEKLQGIPGHSYDTNDPDSLRMRRGKAGGYQKYLDLEALAEIERICASTLSATAKALVRQTQIASRHFADESGSSVESEGALR